MGRVSNRLIDREHLLTGIPTKRTNIIQVVARAFEILRCFDSSTDLLGNLDIAKRSGLPPSTVSRLAHTLTTMGQLTYFPRQLKYRLGPSAIAMGSAIMRAAPLSSLIKEELRNLSNQLNGSVGLLLPERFHLTYLEAASANGALGMNEKACGRVSYANTLAGSAYAAALEFTLGNAFLAHLARERPKDADCLYRKLDDNRQSLQKLGYITNRGLPDPGVSSIAATIWWSQFRTFVILALDLDATLYNDERIHSEAAPQLMLVRGNLQRLLDETDSGWN
jgi:DNA-binding IclR family transcriptional regulator